MNRFTAIAVAAFAFSAFAADDKVTTETTKKTAIDPKKKTATTESTVKVETGGMVNGTTDKAQKKTETKVTDTGGRETTTVTTVNHDAPGMKDDRKGTTKTKVVRDANGKVIEEEYKTK